MAERPILMAPDMVRAILDGTETETRRLVKPQPEDNGTGRWSYIVSSTDRKSRDCFEYSVLDQRGNKFTERGRERATFTRKCPYGQPGDVLWVRETVYYEEHMDDLEKGPPNLPGGRYSHRLVYRATSPDYPVNVGVGKHGWKPSIHMPRWAARIFLEVQEVRVVRLRDISNDGILREGVRSESCNICHHVGGSGCEHCISMAKAFSILWDSCAQTGFRWEDNPWVWVVKFKRLDGYGGAQ